MKTLFQKKMRNQITGGLKIEPKGRMRIGRRWGNDIMIEDITVSKYHAVLNRYKGKLWVIEDRKSKNGTYVNKIRVNRRVILPGDEIAFSLRADVLVAEMHNGRVAILFNDGSPEHKSKMDRIAEMLENRGYIVLNITQLRVGSEIVRRVQEGIDPMEIGEWIEPFTTGFNFNMENMFLYYSKSAFESEDHIEYIIDVFSRISAQTKTLLIEHYDFRGLSMGVKNGAVAFRTDERRLDEILYAKLKGMKKNGERVFGGPVKIKFPDGAKTVIPARTGRRLGIF